MSQCNFVGKVQHVSSFFQSVIMLSTAWHNLVKLELATPWTKETISLTLLFIQ